MEDTNYSVNQNDTNPFFSSSSSNIYSLENVASTSGGFMDTVVENIPIKEEITCIKEETSENDLSICINDPSIFENDHPVLVDIPNENVPSISGTGPPIAEKDNFSTPSCSGNDSLNSSKRPLRKSSRKIRVSNHFKGNIEGRKPNKPPPTWTKLEKRQLLEALKAIGDRSIGALAKFVPTKKPRQVLGYINSLKRQATKVRPKCDLQFSFNSWLRKIKYFSRAAKRHHFDPLPIGILLISLYEGLPHRPLPLDTDGVDFKALYEYLFCEMSELPHPPLDIKTKQILLKSLRELGHTINDMSTSLSEEINENKDLSEWPFNFLYMNPLRFSKVQIDLINCKSE